MATTASISGKGYDRRADVIAAGYNDYIPFADQIVGKHCASIWGDGKGLTYAQAAAVTELNIPGRYLSYMNGNEYTYLRDAKSFDEFRFFTGLTALSEAHPDHIFNWWAMESIVIPDNIAEIDNQTLAYAGYGTSDGVTMTFLRAAPPAFGSIWANLAKIKEIRVPSGSVAAYKAASGMESYVDKITAIS